MTMAELKTKETRADVGAFIKGIAEPRVRKDCGTLIAIMKAATKAEPKLWGSATIGFGKLHYKSASGREGDWPMTGFSPRKGALSLYLMDGLEPLAPLLKKLGPHKTGRSCLYIKRLDDIDLPILKKMVKAALTLCKKKYQAMG